MIDGALVIEAERIRVGVIPYGASVVAVEVPDRHGSTANVVVGLDSVNAYRDEHHNPYFGAMVGRYANRIAGATFDLDGLTYRLDHNDGRHTLHGGARSWARRDWIVQEQSDRQVTFRLESDDGDGGFPGDVITMVEYSVDRGGLLVQGNTVADAPTILSLTNHTYWNLSGVDGQLIDDHELSVRASEYLVVDDELIPTGERAPLTELLDDGPLGDRRLDHCAVMPWDLADPGWEPTLATHVATLIHRGSGRRLWMRSNQPGLQIYTADTIAARRRGVALEAQQLPDAPHHPSFPSTIVRRGDGLFGTVRWSVAYQFDTIE